MYVYIYIEIEKVDVFYKMLYAYIYLYKTLKLVNIYYFSDSLGQHHSH